MSLLSLIAALLMEQWQQIRPYRFPPDWSASYADFFQHRFNTGEHQHGRAAWLLATGSLILALTLSHALIDAAHPLLALVFCTLLIYLTLGFRRLNQQFSDIHQALRDGDTAQAATLLSIWRGTPCHNYTTSELARSAIEQALLAAYRDVFGVIVWFLVGMLLGLGPAGAVLFRLAQYLNARWGSLNDLDHGDFGQFSRRAYRWLEWLPVRLCSATFAIVGNFEDAIYCWRTQARTWPQADEGILLASGAGALGVRLGQSLPGNGVPHDRPELGTGDPADADFMQSTTGLIWRTLVFWLILLLLLSLATLVS
jgi:adenosylcobinamide-phosphate synthase